MKSAISQMVRVYTTSTDAMKITTGCPSSVCRGYELTKDLDFTDDASYRTTANKVLWTANEDRTNTGWQPIGFTFSSIFDGNDHTIANLYINDTSARFQAGLGLFIFGFQSQIRNINLSECGYQRKFISRWTDGCQFRSNHQCSDNDRYR